MVCPKIRAVTSRRTRAATGHLLRMNVCFLQATASSRMTHAASLCLAHCSMSFRDCHDSHTADPRLPALAPASPTLPLPGSFGLTEKVQRLSQQGLLRRPIKIALPCWSLESFVVSLLTLSAPCICFLCVSPLEWKLHEASSLTAGLTPGLEK